ncbi:MAG: hypothetical protein HQ555_11680 [Candidatus Aminicenantes bacterium]|nr:hypothetical protein [Candidatus Aminicenantes bacterium]
MGGTKGLLRWAKGHRVVYYRDVLPRVLPNLSIQQIISEELAQEQPEGDRNLFVHVIQRYDSRFVDDLDAICLSCGFDTDELQRFAGQPVTDGENSQEMRQLTPVARTDEKDGSKIRVKQRTHSQGEKSATKILADHQPQRLKI